MYLERRDGTGHVWAPRDGLLQSPNAGGRVGPGHDPHYDFTGGTDQAQGPLLETDPQSSVPPLREIFLSFFRVSTGKDVK